jgi:hypothetical protein
MSDRTRTAPGQSARNTHSPSGARYVPTGRNAERLAQAAQDGGARSTAAFAVNDVPALTRFFDGRPAAIDHVLVDTPLSASYFSAEGLEARREELRHSPARHTIDGGQQFA